MVAFKLTAAKMIACREPYWYKLGKFHPAMIRLAGAVTDRVCEQSCWIVACVIGVPSCTVTTDFY